ncbi:hypothetical protein [Maribellus maritimus]|uniref:hypothetical protein n=1 Tax=Maribellus maritimus TaxID=2870838 RepID=UPI001EEBF2FC|nr:hypothetical protein [Maribellus maritimus]MCG6189058.1 hypothetical protein [Maribellus maritimus]
MKLIIKVDNEQNRAGNEVRRISLSEINYKNDKKTLQRVSEFSFSLIRLLGNSSNTYDYLSAPVGDF